MDRATFRKIDCILLHSRDLDAAVHFYRDSLGQSLVWRTDVAAGFALPDSDSELVVHSELSAETDIVVHDVPAAFERLMTAGASSVRAPFDIAIGKCAVVKDPFGNVLTILDQSKGKLTVDGDLTVLGVGKRKDLTSK